MARTERLKVIRVVPALDFGGVESRVVLLSSLIDRDRYDYRVCTFWQRGDAARRVEAGGVLVDELGVDPAIRNPRATLALWRYLVKQKPDLIHASVSEGMFHGAIAGLLAGVPVRIIEEVGMPQRSPAARRIFGVLTHLSSATVGVARVVCDYLEVEEGATRVRLVHGCGKPQYFEEMSRSWAPPEGRPFRILNVGRLVHEKNQERLIEAFAGVIKAGVDAELWIAGEGIERAALEAAIERFGLGKSVKLLGFRDDIQSLMNDADLFVLPSVSEGCSVTLIEAMATGTPALASTFLGNVEILGAMADGLTIDALDIQGWTSAMIEATGWDAARREDLGRRGRARAEHSFSPEAHIAAVQHLYDELSGLS